jgi:hypothetical protein
MTLTRRKLFSIIGIFILGAIIGGAIGEYRASRFLGSFFSNGSQLSTIVAIKEKVFILSKLRDRKMEKAIETLKMALDLDLDLMHFSADIHGSENIKKEIKKALKVAKDYRSKFPRATNHSELDKAVSEALAHADN